MACRKNGDEWVGERFHFVENNSLAELFAKSNQIKNVYQCQATYVFNVVYKIFRHTHAHTQPFSVIQSHTCVWLDEVFV